MNPRILRVLYGRDARATLTIKTNVARLGLAWSEFWRSPDNRTLTGFSKPHGLRCLAAAAKAATKLLRKTSSCA